MKKGLAYPKPELEHRGSLMTFNKEGRTVHLGYLMDFRERGIWEPNLGRVDVTPGEAASHNKLLSKAEIDGLDTCEIGQGRNFYPSKDRMKVSTWAGDVASDSVVVNGAVIAFHRGARVFRGRFRKNNESVFFKRVK